MLSFDVVDVYKGRMAPELGGRFDRRRGSMVEACARTDPLRYSVNTGAEGGNANLFRFR